MARVNQIIEEEDNSEAFSAQATESRRINLNDLLEKRKQEKKSEKKTNFLIVSGVTLVATVVLIFNL